jgi:hypothetical protein
MPSSNYFNTFTMSEYNGEYPPYTFPIGVGKGQLGIMLNDFKYQKQKLIKEPYALVYIAPSPPLFHSKYCFLSYLEMICKKYSKKHKKFQMVVPGFIHETIDSDNSFYYKMKKIVEKHYETLSVIYPDKKENFLFGSEDTKSKLVLRGDILPQKREIFISLMKDSVVDILVTGDQSLTDIISCCKNKKIWYQIAPWKKGLATQLSDYFKFFDTYKTSCGTLRSIRLQSKMDWANFVKENDFRIHGRSRIDSILVSNHYMKKNKEFFNDLLKLIQKSRKKESVLKKLWTLNKGIAKYTGKKRNLTKKKTRKNKRTKKK